MSVNRSSSSPEVQPVIDESTQTADTHILNQDVKKDDSAIASNNHDKSSSPEVQAAHESNQTTTSGANKHDNPLAPEFEATTDESTKAVTTQIPDSVFDSAAKRIASGNHGNSSPPEVQPTTAPETSTTQISEADANKHATAISTHDPGNSSPPEVPPTTHDSTESSTTKVAGSNQESTSITQTDPPVANSDTNTAPETSTTQISEADVNKHVTAVSTHNPGNSSAPEVPPSTHDSTESSTSKVAASNQESTSITQTDPPVANSDTNIAPETSTTQISEADANKHATAVSTHDPGNSSAPEVPPSTHDSTESSTTKVAASNQESTSITQIDPPVANSDTKTAPATNRPNISSPEIQQAADPPPEIASTDLPAKKDIPSSDHAPEIASTDLPDNKDIPTSNLIDQELKFVKKCFPKLGKHKEHITKEAEKASVTDIPTSDPTPEQERKHLVNLIEQELKFVKKCCPKLGKHEEHIKKEAEKALDTFEKLRNEICELKELKDLKKTLTKLKLQIPAKYRKNDENDQQKNQQSDGSTANKGGISSKLLKKMPQFHNKLFHESPFCKTIQHRYDGLIREQKLCLLCFTVFPENVDISRRLMVYWWIGEGFVPLADDSAGRRTAEECANNIFEELINMEFIEPVSKRHGRNVAICKMHPMVRSALVMIADKVNFFDFEEYGNPKDFGKFDEIESPEDMPRIYPLGDPRELFDFYDQEHQETGETIDFNDLEGNPTQFAVTVPDRSLLPVDSNGKEIDAKKKFYFYQKKKITTRSYKVCLMGSGLSKGIPWEKLHMLFNVKDDILDFKPEWFLRMKNVNIVFLGRWQSSAAHHIEVDEFKFEESLDHMNHVRFFSLQGVSRIHELPKSISKLVDLLILDLRACHNLEVIPKTIGALKCLTHLDMSECYLLEHMPKEISSLESLQVLKGFVVVESPGSHTCTLHDLEKLENLKKLSLYTHMKEFPLELHLDALKKMEMLCKLTILWGGQESKDKTDESKHKTEESKDKTDESKQDAESKRKDNPVTKVMKLFPKKQWVKGSMRRMNAFNSSTLGTRLQKLDLKCFPHDSTPSWLTPGRLKGLTKLYIRGGQFSDLGQYQEILEWGTSPIPAKETWNVKVLRLKYLDELKMDWRELQGLFPKMTSLEKVKCPRLTLFPCDEHGLWTNKTSDIETFPRVG